MKRIFISLVILLSTLTGISAYAAEQTGIEVLPTMETKSTTANRIWVGTFQIVWNEAIDNVVKKPIKFVDHNSIIAKELNKKSFKKTDISSNSYYTKTGIISPELKTTIEKGIKDKFNETSDILNAFDFSYQPDKIFIYAMLKKDFKFIKPFDKLSDAPFSKNLTPVKYFGIKANSDRKLAKNVDVLFYNSYEDFAVKLLTKDKDEVLLYRTNDDKTFKDFYTDLNKKTKSYNGNKKFTSEDKLRVPDISLYQETSFKDVEGYRIKGTDFKIDKTIETIDFKMNNEGVKLKSEAAIAMTCLAMPIDRSRDFNYTDKFVLFLIEKGQKTPYFAMRVTDVETLNKTGK